MAISKNDLVGLKSKPLYFDGLNLDWDLGLDVRGPYEDSIILSTSKTGMPINAVTLVCDVMADGKMYYSIPLDHLVRVQKPRDVSP